MVGPEKDEAFVPAAWLDQLGGAIMVMNDRQQLRYCNLAARNLAQIKEFSSPIRLADLPNETLRKSLSWLLSVVIRTGARRTANFPVRGENGCWHQFQLEVSPLGEGAGGLYMAALQDVTELHNDLLDRSQHDKMAAVGLLAAGIAHEFNNIWAAVQGYAELAQQSPDFAAELANIVLEQSQRSTQIVRAMLSFSEVSSDNSQQLKLGEVLAGILHLVELELKTRGISASLEIREDPLIEGRRHMLQQIFLNLIINAYQAMEEQGRLTVSLTREGEWAVVRVTDTGRGIEPCRLKRLFEPFYTTKGAFGGNEKVDGHGLGLTMVYNQVRLHQGQVQVQSELGRGSVFTVRLPVVATPVPAASGGENRPRERKGEPQRVLVVDDETVLQSLIKNILRQHRVDFAASGQAALAAAEKQEYDLILLDLIMPGELDGFEVFDRVLEKHPSTRIVIVTGYPGDERLAKYLPRAAGLIRKPFAVDEILAYV